MMDQICAEDVQLVILGTGESQYENMFRHFAWKYPDRVSANIYYSEDMSHKIYAACDAFLMPSLFEPCGLSQVPVEVLSYSLTSPCGKSFDYS